MILKNSPIFTTYNYLQLITLQLITTIFYNLKKQKTHMRKILTLFIMLMFSGILAFAQNRVVTGTVTDDKGLPVEGATVQVKGTKIGTEADQNGTFRISVPPDARLVFSGVGITPPGSCSG